jgi:hypothetical protein
MIYDSWQSDAAASRQRLMPTTRPAYRWAHLLWTTKFVLLSLRLG